ncbi:bifunctional sugar-1-phosphate nucleotidylyltransferase/acetyltransferase [Halobacterium wangiae]|uniref:bifunctional sugar-1-phosphate nucleotidylyltransferase/acetyltransferase n=1 Tax=Halobacterium wangiae TaxID=2902623 RepID=UPI001E5CEE6D|nr:bifunctional sugar-1-phosphate nucleotidylyltransferase/acetyltransferase [Halobacterium wangiae]
MKAVVLAAGEGTRLEPLTAVRPKPMLPVANKPLLEHVVEAAADAGIDEVVLVVGYKRERIQNYFGDGDDWDVDIEYVVQEKQLGTGHAVLQAEDAVGDEFVVLNGDLIMDGESISRLVERYEATGETVMSVIRSDQPSAYGVVQLDGNTVTNVVEKPPQYTDPSNLVNAGAYAFDRSIFDVIRRTDSDGERAITDTLAELAEEERVLAVRFQGRWLDVSHLWDLLSVNARVLDRVGKVVTESTSIHETALVAGNTVVDQDTYVRPNASVLPGVAIGPNVEVGANAVLSNAVVLADATIEAGAVVTDCIVSENATIGANTTIAGGDADVVVNGEYYEDVRLGGVVGDNASLGGGANLAPGTVVGNGADVKTGASVSGRIDPGAVVRRG